MNESRLLGSIFAISFRNRVSYRLGSNVRSCSAAAVIDGIVISGWSQTLLRTLIDVAGMKTELGINRTKTGEPRIYMYGIKNKCPPFHLDVKPEIFGM